MGKERHLKGYPSVYPMDDPHSFQPMQGYASSKPEMEFFPLEEDTVLTEMLDLEMPVMEAMQHLKPALRLLITLYYVDGYSVQEISHMLGLPSGTVKTRMRSARRHLSRTLRMDWEDEL